MRTRFILAILTLAGLVTVLSGTASAVETRLLSDSVFDVTLTDEKGTPQNQFAPGGNVVFNVRLALALSEVKNYPVTVTVVMNGKETQIFSDRLKEGIWVISEKLPVVGSGTVPWKVVVMVRVFNRDEKGSTSFNSYTTAEGSFAIGYR
jgi:hypothetical protein